MSSMPQLKPKKSKEVAWKPDLEHIFGIRKGILYISGEPAAAEVVQTLKSEASMLRMTDFIPLMFNTIGNEAARYALEEPKIGETPEMRSNKLAFAQALAAWNRQVHETLVGLLKL